MAERLIPIEHPENMSTLHLNELKRLKGEIQTASSELAMLANEYEEKRQAAQQRLSGAGTQLSVLVGFMEKEKQPQAPGGAPLARAL